MLITRCQNDELVDTFEFIENEVYFADCFGIKTKEDFRNKVLPIIIDAIVARDKSGEIVLVSYVYFHYYKAFMLNGYARKDYRNPRFTIPACRLAILEYFKKYEINRLDSMCRVDNKTSRLFNARLGFKRIGIIPKYLPHNNIDVDYVYSIIMKGEI